MLARARQLLLLVAVLLSVCTGPVVTAAGAAATVDVRGTWHLSLGYDVNFTTLDCATGAYSGASHANGFSWPESGTVTGNHLVGTAGPYDTLPSYTAYWDLTFDTPDHATGTWSSNHAQSGALVATRVSGPPDSAGCGGTGTPTTAPTPQPTGAPAPGSPGAEVHPTALQVMCTYVVATSLDTCTATVGDAATQPTGPTGRVTFGATAGSFFGDTCQLASSRSAKVTIVTVTRTPSGVAKHGWPQIGVSQIRVSRGGRIVP